MSDLFECILAPFRFLWLVLWPVLSIIFGTIAGILVSVAITTVVFLITLIRTPMHIGKMLCVTVKTQTCFEGHFSTILRVLVCLLVPVVHVLLLLGVTVFSGSVGTLYYIGKSTKTFYKHEYSKTFKKVKSNARLEKKSYLGRYIECMSEYMQDDEASHSTIYALKGLIATVPGLVVATLVFLPYSLATVAITLYRLPINAYKTMKITLFTVVLKWDLRLLVLILLPLIHLIFPLVAFLISMTGSFVWTWCQSTDNVFRGAAPFRKLNKLKESLEEYLDIHVKFVEEQCNRFDHASGIPYGWDGRSYGLEIERILKWQRDFVICCAVVVVEAPVCVVIALCISAIKYVPSCCYLWSQYFRNVCCDEGSSCVNVLSIWPFHVLAIVMLPIGVLICHGIFVLVAVLRIFFQVPWKYLFEREGFVAACQELLETVSGHDKFTGRLCGDYEFFEGWESRTPDRNESQNERHQRSANERRESVASCWDRFISQCIRTTASLAAEGWVALEDIESMDPSVIQSIPGVAILTVLADSIKEKGLDKDDLKWNVDNTVCEESTRLPVLRDGIADHLWPMVRDIKSFLHSNQEKVLTDANLKVLVAMLSSNGDQETSKSKVVVDAAPETNHVLNNTIRTKINRLVLAILRVRPYQDRMELIYSHSYNGVEIEKGTSDDEKDHVDVLSFERVQEQLPQDNSTGNTKWYGSVTGPEETIGLEVQEEQPGVEAGADSTNGTELKGQETEPSIEVGANN